MSETTCTEQWHVFNGGLPKPGDLCKCGKKRATHVIGELEDV